MKYRLSRTFWMSRTGGSFAGCWRAAAPIDRVPAVSNATATSALLISSSRRGVYPIPQVVRTFRSAARSRECETGSLQTVRGGPEGPHYHSTFIVYSMYVYD